jgi:hypothetical protein
MVQYCLVLKKQKLPCLVSIELSATVLTIILMILMAYLGFSYWSLIIPLIIAEIFRSYLYTIMSQIKGSDFCLSNTRSGLQACQISSAVSWA